MRKTLQTTFALVLLLAVGLAVSVFTWTGDDAEAQIGPIGPDTSTLTALIAVVDANVDLVLVDTTLIVADTDDIQLELGDLQGTALGDLSSLLGDPPTDSFYTSIGDTATTLTNLGSISGAIGDSATTLVAEHATIQESNYLLRATLDGVFAHTDQIIESTSFSQAAGYWDTGLTVIVVDADGDPYEGLLATFDDANNRLNLATALPFTPVNGDVAYILSGPSSEMMISISADIDAIAVETSITVAGRRQVDTVNIDDASNLATSVVAFTAAGGGEYMLESCVMRSNNTSAFMTSLALYVIDAGGADPDGQVTLLDATTAIQGNLNEDGEQVAWTGSVSLDSGEVLFVYPIGTGATALDVDVTCTGYGLTDGQSLTPN
jgi:hypothetical protein